MARRISQTRLLPIAAGITCLTLAGCGDQSGAAKASQSQSAPASNPVAAVMSAVQGVSPTARKTGFWHTVDPDNPKQLTRSCVDRKIESVFEQALSAAGKTTSFGSTCTSAGLKKEGAVYVHRTDCTNDKEQTKFHTIVTVSGDPDVEQLTVTTSSGGGLKDSTIKSLSTYKGPCPADFKPGDTESPMLGRINLYPEK